MNEIKVYCNEYIDTHSPELLLNKLINNNIYILYIL